MSVSDTHRSATTTTEPGRDFDLHGIVGVRLVDATEADVATVRRQLGPLQKPLGREPDIVVRFVDRLETHGLSWVAVGETAWDVDGLLVQRGRGRSSARARIPFGEIGRRPQIICERTMPAVPHLLAVINLTALTKGVLPLHASAFTMDGLGVLVTGWSKAGKTESLLACMGQGADYIGDEWVYLTSDAKMLGLPEPIRLWAWHLHQLPRLLQERTRRERVRLAGWHAAAVASRQVGRTGLPGAAVVSKGAPIVARQAYLQIPPHELFGREAVTLKGDLGAVVLVVNSEAADIVASATTGHEVARRMLASLGEERAPFLEHYAHFLYAFPGASNDVIESAAARERDLLSDLLDGRAAALVAHPYPCDIAHLGQAVLSAAKEQNNPRSTRRQASAVAASGRGGW